MATGDRKKMKTSTKIKFERQFNASTTIKPLIPKAKGKIKILEMEVNGIVSSRIRHIIKRYVKRVGFVVTKVIHTNGASPFSMNLVVLGYITEPITYKHIHRIEYLKNALTTVLGATQNGQIVHPSHADDEQLRLILAKKESALKHVYYERYRAKAKAKTKNQNDDSNTTPKV